MKTIANGSRQFVTISIMVLSLGIFSPVWAQPETDLATGIPQLMVVQSIDSEAGTVTLDGNVYRLAVKSRPGPAAISPNGRALSLSDLEPGMEVLVSTDGTEPSRSNTPALLGLWKPN